MAKKKVINKRRIHAAKRDRLRNRMKYKNLPCALCGKPIDYSLPAYHPWSYELDEIIPVSRGGSPIDERNVQPTHRFCNQLKGNRMIKSFRELSAKDKISKDKKMSIGEIRTSSNWIDE